MKITYEVTGAMRKSLVGAISQELQAPTLYLGAPSFSYSVGGYRIDKTGTVTGPDNRDLIADLQGLHGFQAVSEDYDEPAEGWDAAAWHDTCDREDRDADGNWDGNETPYYRMPRYTEEEFGLGVKRTDPVGEDGMQASDVTEPDVADGLTVEFPLDGFNPETLDNLVKMVAAKEALIKAAMGAKELPIQITEDTVRFPWFTLSDPNHAAIYAQFIWALCKTAKEKKRVTAKEQGLPDNPKYAFRCFLLSIGLIGSEYKSTRKLLLARLNGCSFSKSGTQQKRSEVTDDE